MMNNRCYYLDMAKVITAFLVILGHLYSSDSLICLYIYSFHMPLFFLISGIFHKRFAGINWKEYANKLLWPIVVFILLDILAWTLFRKNSIGSYLKNNLLTILTGQYDRILWFLFALFWCKVMADIYLYKLNTYFFLFWGIALFAPQLLSFKLPLMISQGLMAFPFYLLGFLFRDRFLEQKPSSLYLIPFIICLLLNISITLIHGRISMLGVDFGHLAATHGINWIDLPLPTRLLCFFGDVILFYLNGIIGSLMIVCLSLSISNREYSLISKLAMSLITVLGTQYLFIYPIAQHIGIDNPLWVSCLLSICIFYASYLMHLLLRLIYNSVK